jgi:hypothetical protein
MIDNFPTLDQLRLPDQQFFKHAQTTPKERKISSKPPKVQGEFLKGPIPLAWLGRAAKLPGKASLATALAIMFEVGRRRSQEIVLTTAILKRFGVNRKAKYRALKLLEKAGLISVVRRPRKNPLVAVLVVEDGTTVDSEKPIVSADAVPTSYSQSLIQNEGSIQCSI